VRTYAEWLFRTGNSCVVMPMNEAAYIEMSPDGRPHGHHSLIRELYIFLNPESVHRVSLIAGKIFADQKTGISN
jgi:hypothetical protein